jgi:hypothetical protein
MDPVPCVVVLVIIGGISYWIVNEGNKKAAEAKQAYLQSLAKLKLAPTNADLKQRTLELGRAYSNLTRNKQGVTVFDEIALMNDINAACAGATVAHKSSNEKRSQTIEERLAKLSDLKSKGLISEQEYASSRQKILDEV